MIGFHPKQAWQEVESDHHRIIEAYFGEISQENVVNFCNYHLRDIPACFHKFHSILYIILVGVGPRTHRQEGVGCIDLRES